MPNYCRDSGFESQSTRIYFFRRLFIVKVFGAFSRNGRIACRMYGNISPRRRLAGGGAGRG